MVTPYWLFEEMPAFFYKEHVHLCTPSPFIFKFPLWTIAKNQASTTIIFTCQGFLFPIGVLWPAALGLLPGITITNPLKIHVAREKSGSLPTDSCDLQELHTILLCWHCVHACDSGHAHAMIRTWRSDNHMSGVHSFYFFMTQHLWCFFHVLRTPV